MKRNNVQYFEQQQINDNVVYNNQMPMNPNPMQGPPMMPMNPNPMQGPPMMPMNPNPMQGPPMMPMNPNPMQGPPMMPMNPNPMQGPPMNDNVDYNNQIQMKQIHNSIKEGKLLNQQINNLINVIENSLDIKTNPTPAPNNNDMNMLLKQIINAQDKKIDNWRQDNRKNYNQQQVPNVSVVVQQPNQIRSTNPNPMQGPPMMPWIQIRCKDHRWCRWIQIRCKDHRWIQIRCKDHRWCRWIQIRCKDHRWCRWIQIRCKKN
ncbi:hypothetical protein [Spiroplasma endosymbiont of Amphibalanus improvisus]|uniref:hypothetical protein n=1 Tax=Spiroplasma endosymbiont of Amphibalanus improvisus TaxID=3066327 RepID=UPI00313AAB0E